jgi:hypothetical protein
MTHIVITIDVIEPAVFSERRDEAAASKPTPIDRPALPEAAAARPDPSPDAESAPDMAAPNVNVAPAAAPPVAVIAATNPGNAAPTTDRAPATYLSPGRRTEPAVTVTADEQKLLGDIPAHLRRLN